ncbi:unnamed protein product [Urochloa humidicola]
MSDNQPVKLNMLMILALLLMSHGVGNIRCSVVPDNSTDMLALLDFRATTKDPTGSLSSWNTSIDHCKWRGVVCNPKNHGRVTALHLANQGLSGPIAASVGNLTLLHTLDLSTNQFSGQIPHLNNLQKMQILNLSYNSLDGIIPDTLTNCSNLKELHLYHNLLKGAIPQGIGLLKNLVFFALNNNNLTGTIPPTLGNITNLEQFFLQQNQLEGTIPDELGQFSNISKLGLGQNMLSGSIPVSLFNLSSLQVLELRTNQLRGSLPNNMGNRLSNLRILYLGDNWLEGRLPDSFGNASMLLEVVLQCNNFTGPISSSFGKLSSLYKLDLGLNMLEAKNSESWEFLHALENCSALAVLALSNNQLQGVIPNSVGNLPSSLQYLLLGGNKLSGTIPPSLGKLSGLVKLTLDSNSLTGSIDGWIGNLQNLRYLNLRENNLSGPIPPIIGNLKGLAELYLDNNKFDSHIPQNIGNLQGLGKLDLSYNNLQSSIPPEVGNLKLLIELHLSSNVLTGEIPDTLCQCVSLADIRLDQNLLTGSIPASFGNLSSLNVLNLSHNSLSGTIPRNLGDLAVLDELDLSYNRFHGQIPTNGVFKNSAGVSLEGNWGLCGGVDDLRLPSCPTGGSRKVSRQYYLIRVLIPVFGFMSLLLLIYFLILEKKVPRRKYSESTSFGDYFLKVSYNDLAQATNNFSESNLVGRGSYGSVYRGTIKESKIDVAVKVFNLDMQGAERSFMAECEALRSIQHRNLLPIITACSTVDNIGNVFKALVYEFMPNGNLDSWIHHTGDEKATKLLGLTQTISIAANIADALDYLHHDCGRPTVHCDLKPSNVLLDEDMNALLGDFGIARFYSDSRLALPGSVSTTGVKGTIGYIAPEYAQGGHLSTSGDSYSFGIVLLEMMTGKRPTDPMFMDGLDLVKFVERSFPDQICHVIDPRLQEECKVLTQTKMVPENIVCQCLASLLQVALSCAHPLPSERANMKEAASKVNEIKASHLGWKLK